MFKFYRTQTTEFFGGTVIWYRLISILKRKILFDVSMSLVRWHFIHHTLLGGGGMKLLWLVGSYWRDDIYIYIHLKSLERYFASLEARRRTYGWGEGCIGSWWGNRREGDHWGDLGVDGWIILWWIFRRWDVGIWTGLGWPRIETGGGRLWVR